MRDINNILDLNQNLRKHKPNKPPQLNFFQIVLIMDNKMKAIISVIQVMISF